jgi:hypothetical protein
MQKIINYYNTNAKFHAFVLGLEMSIATALTSYSGGFPTTKSAWIAFAAFIGGAAWGGIKRWLQQNVASAPVALKQ